jgi:hypothetical protein
MLPYIASRVITLKRIIQNQRNIEAREPIMNSNTERYRSLNDGIMEDLNATLHRLIMFRTHRYKLLFIKNTVVHSN